MGVGGLSYLKPPIDPKTILRSCWSTWTPEVSRPLPTCSFLPLTWCPNTWPALPLLVTPCRRVPGKGTAWVSRSHHLSWWFPLLPKPVPAPVETWWGREGSGSQPCWVRAMVVIHTEPQRTHGTLSALPGPHLWVLEALSCNPAAVQSVPSGGQASAGRPICESPKPTGKCEDYLFPRKPTGTILSRSETCRHRGPKTRSWERCWPPGTLLRGLQLNPIPYSGGTLWRQCQVAPGIWLFYPRGLLKPTLPAWDSQGEVGRLLATPVQAENVKVSRRRQQPLCPTPASQSNSSAPRSPGWTEKIPWRGPVGLPCETETMKVLDKKWMDQFQCMMLEWTRS